MFSPPVHNKAYSALDTLSLAATALTDRNHRSTSPSQQSSPKQSKSRSSSPSAIDLIQDSDIVPDPSTLSPGTAADSVTLSPTLDQPDDLAAASSPANSTKAAINTTSTSKQSINSDSIVNENPSISSTFEHDDSKSENDSTNLALLSKYASKDSDKSPSVSASSLPDQHEIFSTPKPTADDVLATLPREKQESIDPTIGSSSTNPSSAANSANNGNSGNNNTNGNNGPTTDVDDDYDYSSNSALNAIHPSLAAMSTDSNIYSNPADFNTQYASYYSHQQSAQGSQPGSNSAVDAAAAAAAVVSASAGGPLNLMSISNITSPNGTSRSINARTTLPPLQSINSPSGSFYKSLGPGQEDVFDPKFTSNKRSKSYNSGNSTGGGGGMYDGSQPTDDSGLSPQSWSQRQSAHLLSPDSSLPSVSALHHHQAQNQQQFNENYHLHQNTTDLPHGLLMTKNEPGLAMGMVSNANNNPNNNNNNNGGITINANGKRLNEYHHNPSTGGSARKKRQCSECQGWFSNLATHRSIHLANNSRPHTCDICKRGFARPNDLFRHQKSHRGDAPFRCPLFVRAPITHPAGFGNLEPACHQNGGFSRCDTYKNHLKAMHFEYPPGTKKKMRNGTSGKCKACQMPFDSSDQWIAQHIETGACKIIQQIKEMTMKNQLGHEQ